MTIPATSIRVMLMATPAVSLIPAMRMPERIRMIMTADGRSGRPTRSEK